MKLHVSTAILPLLFFCFGCEPAPLDYLRDPRPDGATGIWTGQWLIYGDKLETGGGIVLVPDSGNQMINLSFHDPERNNVIMYSWNGQDVAGQHEFSGVSFTVASSSKTYDITPPKDLSAGGYKKVTFYAKVNLSENTFVRFTGPVTSFSVEQKVNCDWNRFTIFFEPHMLRTVREFFVISFHYTGNNKSGNGGTVYVDDVRYER